jgi:SRSO17 transposase
MESRLLSPRVEPSHGLVDGEPPRKELWLLAEWPEHENEPTNCFLADLAPSYTLRRSARLAKSGWKTGQYHHQHKEVLGLDHYEGRNWNGWRRQVTLVMLKYAFLTLETLRGKEDFRADPAGDAA